MTKRGDMKLCVWRLGVVVHLPSHPTLSPLKLPKLINSYCYQSQHKSKWRIDVLSPLFLYSLENHQILWLLWSPFALILPAINLDSYLLSWETEGLKFKGISGFREQKARVELGITALWTDPKESATGSLQTSREDTLSFALDFRVPDVEWKKPHFFNNRLLMCSHSSLFLSMMVFLFFMYWFIYLFFLVSAFS